MRLSISSISVAVVRAPVATRPTSMTTIEWSSRPSPSSRSNLSRSLGSPAVSGRGRPGSVAGRPGPTARGAPSARRSRRTRARTTGRGVRATRLCRRARRAPRRRATRATWPGRPTPRPPGSARLRAPSRLRLARPATLPTRAPAARLSRCPTRVSSRASTAAGAAGSPPWAGSTAAARRPCRSCPGSASSWRAWSAATWSRSPSTSRSGCPSTGPDAATSRPAGAWGPGAARCSRRRCAPSSAARPGRRPTHARVLSTGGVSPIRCSTCSPRSARSTASLVSRPVSWRRTPSCASHPSQVRPFSTPSEPSSDGPRVRRSSASSRHRCPAQADDVLDAHAALWTARRVAAGGEERLGGDERDRRGLRMEIVR